MKKSKLKKLTVPKAPKANRDHYVALRMPTQTSGESDDDDSFDDTALAIPRVPGQYGRKTTNEISEIREINTPSFMDDLQVEEPKFSIIPDDQKSENLG